MKSTDYSEDTLIERPALELFDKLRWETANCFHECGHGIGKKKGKRFHGKNSRDLFQSHHFVTLGTVSLLLKPFHSSR